MEYRSLSHQHLISLRNGKLKHTGSHSDMQHSCAGCLTPSRFDSPQHHRQRNSLSVNALSSQQGSPLINQSGTTLSSHPSFSRRQSPPRRNGAQLAEALCETTETREVMADVPCDFCEHYELVAQLGAGEFGKVWSATRRADVSMHAVKIMPKMRLDRTPEENMKRIHCEVAIWRQCQGSEFVCRLQGVYQDDDSVYLVQELCRGGDLRAVLEDGPLSEVQCAEIMRAVLDVISVCHRNDVTFGDIKPANFLLKEPLLRCKGQGPCEDCEHRDTCELPPPISVRATDFGFSQCCGNLRGPQRRVGSPVYMAPELWCQEQGPQADVWAAGVMMFQLLSGRYPFWEQPADEVRNLPLHQVMMAVSSNPIYMNGPAWDSISKPAKDMVLAMLDRNGATRITAEQALRHPWFKRTLGFCPSPSPISLPITMERCESEASQN